MNEVGNTLKPLSQASHPSDTAANKLQGGMQSTQQAANKFT